MATEKVPKMGCVLTRAARTDVRQKKEKGEEREMTRAEMGPRLRCGAGRRADRAVGRKWRWDSGSRPVGGGRSSNQESLVYSSPSLARCWI